MFLITIRLNLLIFLLLLFVCLFTANIVYGGHVHDAFDSEVVESAAKAFLSREAPLWLCEGHILSDIINNPDNFGKNGDSLILNAVALKYKFMNGTQENKHGCCNSGEGAKDRQNAQQKVHV